MGREEDTLNSQPEIPRVTTSAEVLNLNQPEPFLPQDKKNHPLYSLSVLPTRLNRLLEFAASSGHKVLCNPIVINPTNAPKSTAIQQNATFSLHACRVASDSSFIPRLRTTSGIHQVKNTEETFHQLIPLLLSPPLELDPKVDTPAIATFPPLDPPRDPSCPPATGELVHPGVLIRGLISGTGATALSGRVRVFPLRKSELDLVREVTTGRVSWG